MHACIVRFIMRDNTWLSVGARLQSPEYVMLFELCNLTMPIPLTCLFSSEGGFSGGLSPCSYTVMGLSDLCSKWRG